MSSLEILIFAPTAHGGIAEYAFCQARALHQAGVSLLLLASPDFLAGRECPFPISRILRSAPCATGSRLNRRLGHARTLIGNTLRLAREVRRHSPRLVLMDSYVEYLSPVWIWPHALLARWSGVRYAANLHDPVRNHVIGPQWWHSASVRLAYLPLRAVLVHGTVPAAAGIPDGVKVVAVPHGSYDLPPCRRTRAAIREDWGLASDLHVFLAFGYIRDGKNLDLAVRALASVPRAALVIAGSVASANDRPSSFYGSLAQELGVSDRVCLREGFVGEAQLSEYFEGADAILLTYSSRFHSQSGVLHLAASAAKPVLASAGSGPLVEDVRHFALGVTVEPDSAEAVARGMKQIIEDGVAVNWAEYRRQASWAVNAARVQELASA